MRRFGLDEHGLAAALEHRERELPEPLRAVIAFEVARARELFAAGHPLLDSLRGRARLAVAAFVAGGEAALVAIEREGHDIRHGAPRASRPRRAVALVRLLLARRRQR
jgi:phytoene/squalene synthetase